MARKRRYEGSRDNENSEQENNGEGQTKVAVVKAVTEGYCGEIELARFESWGVLPRGGRKGEAEEGLLSWGRPMLLKHGRKPRRHLTPGADHGDQIMVITKEILNN